MSSTDMTGDSVDDGPSSTSTYKHVTFKKSDGDLKLNCDALIFFPSTTDVTEASSKRLSLPWHAIAKHQVSPASYPKALLKLTTTENGKPITFQLFNREELERIRKDITTRLRRFRSSSQSSTADNLKTNNASTGEKTSKAIRTKLSGKKRAHNEILTPLINKDAKNINELDANDLKTIRSSLLQSDSSLRAEFQFMVEEEKSVSEDDFWKTHQNLLQEEHDRISNVARTRASSMLQSQLLPQQGPVRVTLSVEEMRQIFILYPAVHKAYEDKVPVELSAEEFWRTYLESEYFHRGRDRGHCKAAGAQGKIDDPSTTTGKDNIFSSYEEKGKRESVNPTKNSLPNDNSTHRKWGTKLAVGQFDLASTYQTERGDLLEGPRDNHPSDAGDDGKGASIIQKYNRHWTMVMHPGKAVAGSDFMDVARHSVQDVLKDDEDSKPSGGLDKEMKQLVKFSMASHADAHGMMLSDKNDYEQISMSNLENYNTGRFCEVQISNSDAEKFANLLASKLQTLSRELHEEERSINSDKESARATFIKNCFPPPQLGNKLLKMLTDKIAQDILIATDNMDDIKTISEDFKKQLHANFVRSSELLRHFFGLRKLEAQGNNTSRTQKLSRIVKGMENFHREMERMIKNLPDDETGNVMRKMCLPIADQLNWAFELHKSGNKKNERSTEVVAIDE